MIMTFTLNIDPFDDDLTGADKNNEYIDDEVTASLC